MVAGGRLWEPEEIAAIRDVPVGEIAAVAKRLGRSVQAVRIKRCKLGIAREAAPRWSEDESEALDALIADGVKARDAARFIGRSERAGYTRRYRQRQHGEVLARGRSGVQPDLEN